MTKFTIKVSGLGGELFIHPITDEQYDRLDQLGQIDQDNITDITNIEDYFSSDESLLGAYNDSECYIVEVFEGDKEIWSSLNNDEPLEEGEYQISHTGNYLLCEDYVKGSFFEFDFEAENFDISKLKLVITDVGEVRELITGIMYDDIVLEKSYNDSDYWSKGLSYFLSIK